MFDANKISARSNVSDQTLLSAVCLQSYSNVKKVIIR